MTFKDWKQLSAWEAASHLRHSVDALPPSQRKAAIASMPHEAELVNRFSSAQKNRPLSGIPFFVKDLFETKGDVIQAGSAFLKEVRQPAQADAALVTALKEQGAVCVGKTHLYEFAYGLTGENKHFGDCEHPRFSGRTTGGSSSGSALVVASEVAPLAIGTDTAGSLRLPAAFCGLFSFRTAPKSPWMSDAFPLSTSFDTAGWFTVSANEMLTTLTALTAVKSSTEGQPKGYYLPWPSLDEAVSNVFTRFTSKLCPVAGKELTNEAVEIFKEATATYTVIQSKETYEVHLPWLKSYEGRYSPEVLERIKRAENWTKTDIKRALKNKEAIELFFENYFKTADFLILPSAPFVALSKAHLTNENRSRILELTTPGSIAGRPILTIPVILDSGLSLGLQVIVKDQASPALAHILSLLQKP